MNYLPAVYIVFFGFIALVAESSVVSRSDGKIDFRLNKISIIYIITNRSEPWIY